MQNVSLKSHARDVCGHFVVVFLFAEGNVCANGACDRVIRVVRCCGTSDAEALRDDARWFCSAAEFFVTELCETSFLLMPPAFSLQLSATVVLCHVKLMSGVLSLITARHLSKSLLAW